MVAYSTSHSKWLTKLPGNWEPCGSYTTVNVILNQPAEPVLTPANDFHIKFENNQKVGFTSGRIREGSTIPMSICTSTTYLEPQSATNLQQNDTFTNDKWLIDQSDLSSKLQTLEEATGEFQNYDCLFIDEHIKYVRKELEMGPKNEMRPKDHIDLSTIPKALGQYNLGCSICCQVYL